MPKPETVSTCPMCANEPMQYQDNEVACRNPLCGICGVKMPLRTWNTRADSPALALTQSVQSIEKSVEKLYQAADKEDALEAARVAQWRSVTDLPTVLADPDDEWDVRCVVVWQDATFPQDQGVETTSLAAIRGGDFTRPDYANAVWRSVMDAPPLALLTKGANP